MTELLTDEVVVTLYGRKYHKPTTNSFKEDVCGGFVKAHVARIPRDEAEEQGYSPCRNCWVESKTP